MGWCGVVKTCSLVLLGYVAANGLDAIRHVAWQDAGVVAVWEFTFFFSR